MSGDQPIEFMGSGAADAVVFLNRLLRLDPVAVVRMIPGPDGGTGPTVSLWASLPWRVLATAALLGVAHTDRTVAAAALRDRLAGARDSLRVDRRDADWHWALPPAGQIHRRDLIKASDLRQVGAAAANTLTEVRASGLQGRAVGSRVVRDVLLDHVSIRVTTNEGEFAIGQRLIQGVLRMGFLGTGDAEVAVLTAGAWLGLAGPHGTVWHRAARTFDVTPVRRGQTSAKSPHRPPPPNG